MKITFLGTGTSHGVPSIDCVLSGYTRCKKNVCRLSGVDPRHRRTRSSIIVEYEGKHILVDVSSDFRQQALQAQIPKIDSVLITHCHADHICGIPDIRSYTSPNLPPLNFYGTSESMESIKRTFFYIFSENTFVGGGIPRIKLNVIDKQFSLFNLEITPLSVTHGNLAGCVGYKIGNMAYIPDMKRIDNETKEMIKNLDCLILNCLRDEGAPLTHLILGESIAMARELAPKRCYFTHMSHDIHYLIDGKKLDNWMEFAYDGLKIDL